MEDPIRHWLAGISSVQHERRRPGVAHSSKRKHEDCSYTSPRVKRSTLSHVSGNACKMSSAHRSGSRSGEAHSIGRKHRRSRSSPAKSHLQSDSEDELQKTPELQDTPRPSQPPSILENAPRLSSRRSFTSRSSASSRPSSPSKKSARLRHLTQSIAQRSPDTEEELPKGILGLQELWRKMDDIASGVGIIPAESTEDIRSLDRAFQRGGDVVDNFGARSSLGRVPDADWARMIVSESTTAIQDDASEHAWNSLVHGQIGSRAIWLSKHRRKLRFKDV